MRWNYALFVFFFLSRRAVVFLCAAFGLFLASGKLCFSWKKIVFLFFGKDFFLFYVC